MFHNYFAFLYRGLQLFLKMQLSFILAISFLCLFLNAHAASYTPILLSANSGANYSLPSLPYSTSDLEPFIDNATVNVHYNGHHLAYTNNMNNILASWRALVSITVISHIYTATMGGVTSKILARLINFIKKFYIG